VRIAYFDCFSGISGDMCLGALIDAGLSLRALERELKKIPLEGYKLHVRRVKRSFLSAIKVIIEITQKPALKKDGSIRKWKDAEKIIKSSSLSSEIKQRGLKALGRIFDAEAHVHGMSFEKVHLHELGATDCMIDIFGTIIGLHLLGIEEVYSSPVNLGSGLIQTKHGMIPVPAPATAEILKNVPVYSEAVSSELTTPTGAAIISEISSGFGDIPVMKIEKVGIGAADKDLQGWPNVLRILIGEIIHIKTIHGDEVITVIETNIDDMNPQIFEYVIEKLYKTGALDVYLTQVIMKKGRPGTLMTVLSRKKQRDSLINIILRETSTIGLRFYETRRRVLEHEIKTVNTEWGKVKVKSSKLDKKIIKISPEYDDCKKIADKFNVPLMLVMKKIT
jgi:hypothetical protein